MKYSEITLEQAYMLKGAYCDGDKQRIVFHIEQWNPIDIDGWIYRYILR